MGVCLSGQLTFFFLKNPQPPCGWEVARPGLQPWSAATFFLLPLQRSEQQPDCRDGARRLPRPPLLEFPVSRTPTSAGLCSGATSRWLPMVQSSAMLSGTGQHRHTHDCMAWRPAKQNGMDISLLGKMGGCQLPASMCVLFWRRAQDDRCRQV